MHYGIIRTVALVAGLAMSSTFSIGADQSSAAGESATKTKPVEQRAKAKSAKPKPRNLVDINSAKETELKKLPGVDDAQVQKIIAGRPYRSKAELVTRKVVPRGIYEGFKRDIIAKQK